MRTSACVMIHMTQGKNLRASGGGRCVSTLRVRQQLDMIFCFITDRQKGIMMQDLKCMKRAKHMRTEGNILCITINCLRG